MLSFSKHIESFLRTGVRNTNHKEQNLQGRLYSYLLDLEKEGYVVEMETSTSDSHLQVVIKDPKELCKKEIDIFVYKKEGEKITELYAAELKWIYHNRGAWNVTDGLPHFETDARFCRQLAQCKLVGSVETCSVVVYDFDEAKQVAKCLPKKDKDRKMDFVGGNYANVKNNEGKLHVDNDCTVLFQWKRLPQESQIGNTDYRYYIMPFRNNFSATMELTEMVKQKYSFRHDKALSLVDQSSFGEKLKIGTAVSQTELESGFRKICKEIDSGEIL